LLLDAPSTCRDTTWMVTCGKIDLALADLYIAMYRGRDSTHRGASSSMGAPAYTRHPPRRHVNPVRQAPEVLPMS
jgi:hypothetical protein